MDFVSEIRYLKRDSNFKSKASLSQLVNTKLLEISVYRPIIACIQFLTFSNAIPTSKTGDHYILRAQCPPTRPSPSRFVPSTLHSCIQRNSHPPHPPTPSPWVTYRGLIVNNSRSIEQSSAIWSTAITRSLTFAYSPVQLQIYARQLQN